MSFLEVAAITKKIEQGFELSSTSFAQEKAQKIAIAGETGSGKTTLLKIIAGLVQPDTGAVMFEGKRVEGPDEQLVPGHPGIGYLSQHYELRNNYRVEELLEYATKINGEAARVLFAVCRIDHLVKRRTDQLSGGEKQRIALARLLVGAPRLLLLDEPFSNLDPIHKKILKGVIEDIGQKLSVTCLLTSHDPLDTLSWADQIIVLQQGKILQQDNPENIYRKPINEYVAGLFGDYELLDQKAVSALGSKETLPGSKRLLIRPGDIIQVNDHSAGVEAVMTSTAFWGNYYQSIVRIGDLDLSLRTLYSPPARGEMIRVALRGAGHYI